MLQFGSSDRVVSNGRSFCLIPLLLAIAALCTAPGALLAGSGGGGPGSGKTSAPLTITGGGANLTVQTGRSLPAFSISATFKDAAPNVTLTAAPAGLIIESTRVFPPSRGGPWTTMVTTSAWTPTRDEIGPQKVVFTATAGGASQSAVMNITVQDAPAPVTGLRVISQGGVIDATWLPSAVGGVAPILYRVEGCYSTGLRAFGTVCETIETTPNTNLSFPANHTESFPGPYIFVMVTPIDANGVEGGTVTIVPTILTP